jgi:hypothetical protein
LNKDIERKKDERYQDHEDLLARKRDAMKDAEN